MKSFKDFLLWYNNKDVVPTLEAMQKMIEFYHQSEIDMLKLGCVLPNLANICLHKSTDSKFYSFTEKDKDFLEKIREDMVGGPSIVFTRKAVVDETFIRKSTNLCISIVGIDQANSIPVRCVNQCLLDCLQDGTMTLILKNSSHDRTKHALLKLLSFLIFSKLVRSVKLKVMLELVAKRRLIALVLNEFVTIVTLFLKQGLLFPLLSTSRSSPIIDGQRNYERDKKEGTRSTAQRIYPTEKNTNFLICGSAIGGNYNELMRQ